MAYSFSCTSAAVMTAKRRLGINSAAIGRGFFSIVYAHPDRTRNSVLKISNDPAARYYLTEGHTYGLNRYPFFPQVVDPLDELNNVLAEIPGGCYAVELEKLAKNHGGAETKAVSLFVANSFSSLTAHPTRHQQAVVARAAKRNPQLYADLEEFSTRLGTFAADYGLRLDALTGGNSMRRGDTFVANDPVFDLALHRRLSRRY